MKLYRLGKRYIPGYKHLDAITFDHFDYVCVAQTLTTIED
jgi:hypothetical protein